MKDRTRKIAHGCGTVNGKKDEEGQLYPTLCEFVDQSIANERHRSQIRVLEQCGCKEHVDIFVFNQSDICSRDGALGVIIPNASVPNRYLLREVKKLSAFNFLHRNL